MNYRTFGRTGRKVSEIGFGGWAIGADWGDVSERQAEAALKAAYDLGVNFFDTADVYGDGRSEKIIARVLNKKNVFIATKAGRRLKPHTAAGYTKENISAFIDRSLQNLQAEQLDLVQLHCPPTAVYSQPELFAALNHLVEQGKIKHFGVSVEKVEEALKAIEYPGVTSVQIIFNIFRQRPAEIFFAAAKKRNVAIIVRVPLASGLLSGKINKDTVFAKDDHRLFNRHGEFFDVGETFAGVDFETGLKAVEALKQLVPNGFTLSQFALKWILMHDAVTTVIPGAKTPEQAMMNAQASDLPVLSIDSMKKVKTIYETYIKSSVHERW